MSKKPVYKKRSLREAIFAQPDSYIGSTQTEAVEKYIYDNANNKIELKKIDYNEGLDKIFDEILTNAVDQVQKTQYLQNLEDQTKNIRIMTSLDNGEISVYNDGQSIPLDKNEEDIYIPQMIFGETLSSSNYEEGQSRDVGGSFGIGAKATNIFSKRFIVDIVNNNQRYVQLFQDNMTLINSPKITKKQSKPYVQITFVPDYQKLGIEKLTQDFVDLFKKKTYDAAGTIGNLCNSIKFNDQKIQIKNFYEYSKLYLKDDTFNIALPSQKTNQNKFSDWTIVIAQSQGKFSQVSFVNNVLTREGGKHVDQILRQIIDEIKKRKEFKTYNVLDSYIKDNIMIFVKAYIENPTFQSFRKESLNGPPINQWLFKPKIQSQIIDKIAKSPILKKIIERCEQKETKLIEKSQDVSKKSSITGVPQLKDAEYAGTKKSQQCSLILTEGISAMNLVLAGVSSLQNGHQIYGIYPLRGKVLNVRGLTAKKISENKEIADIKKIMGLQQGKEYSNTSELRYGNVVIMADSDSDGHHISSLIFSMFESVWPSLIRIDGFLRKILTPMIKATKNNEMIEFYTKQDFEHWIKNNPKGYAIKYYKGLGTSNKQEAKVYFQNQKLIQYVWKDNNHDDFLLAFDKGKEYANIRKKWIVDHLHSDVLDYTKSKIDFSEVINKELVHFSIEDVKRSIPSIMDGLKPSQRKILYACFLRNLQNDIKVSQLGGYVSEKTGYEHGEASLYQTIVQMAQNFVGSNNINLLMPNGQFGARYNTKASAERYIFTKLDKITQFIFNKQDQNILNYLKDDQNEQIEPEFYVPCIPMILVNGAIGIGTGYSTDIPQFDPIQVIEQTQNYLQQQLSFPLIPSFRGFKGEIKKLDIDQDQNDEQPTDDTTSDTSLVQKGSKKRINDYISFGQYRKISSTEIEITELPIGIWTDDYNVFLDKLKAEQEIKDYIQRSSDTDIHIILIFSNPEQVNKLLQSVPNGPQEFKKIHKILKLMTFRFTKTTNMHLFDSQNNMKKYKSTQGIIKDFCDARITFYQKRYNFVIDQLKRDLSKITNKARFIQQIIDNSLKIQNIPRAQIILSLEKLKYDKENNSYDYLLQMNIYNLTLEKKEELLRQKQEKSMEYNTYQSKTPKDIWLEELDILRQQLPQQS